MKINLRQSGLLPALAGLFILVPPAGANISLPPLFSDHVVLQRDRPVPIWGRADRGETVTVSFCGQRRSTVADTTGRWSVRLGRFAANAAPQSLTVTGKNTVVLKDVVVGEVWLCSGQSNMTYRLGYDKEYHAAEIAAAGDPGLRCFTVDYQAQPTPLADFLPSQWQKWDVATPDTVEHNFPAVGYYFGKELREKLGPGVPIGLIHASYGATPAEAWVSYEGLSTDPALKAMADRQIANMRSYPDNLKMFEASVTAWEEKYGAHDTGNTGESLGWAKPGFDDSDWKLTSVPMSFSRIGMKAGGAVWLRKQVDVPAASAGRGLNLKLNYSSDDDSAYFNGKRLEGGHESPPFFNEARSFTIPGSLVHAGPNTLAVRVFSHSQDGGLTIQTRDFEPGLSGDDWRYKIEFANPELPAGAISEFPRAPYAVPQYTANYLFNAMIHPLLPYAIRGVIWYQGESNTSRANQYRKLLPALIADWRTHWGRKSLPFYIVQLANFMKPTAQPGDSAWAELREAQFLTAAHEPASGLAVTIDIGEADTIHPRDKMDVGKRLALIALANDYGRKIESSGPLYVSSKVEGIAIRIRFRHTGGGLVAENGGSLKQFAIAGTDKQFVWADARIDGDTVVVSSPQVPHPAVVRYAWADNPEGCNLFNGAGLPASPFQTDDWPGQRH